MSAANTPGPWVAETSLGYTRSAGIFAGKNLVATACAGIPSGHLPADITEQEALANARLIAAAPELLDALMLAVRQNEHDMVMTGEELRQCLAAISKATGGAA